MRQERLRRHLTKLIKRVLGKSWTLSLFGSAASGLAHAHSDLDLQIVDQASTAPLSRAESQRALRRLAGVCAKSGMRTQRILHARTPIIKLFDPESGVHVDVAGTDVGDQDRALVASEMLVALIKVDSRFRRLTLFVKWFACVWCMRVCTCR